MKKTIIIFSLLILCLTVLFQASSFTFFKDDLNKEVLVAIIAIVFFFIGVALNQKSFSKKDNMENPTGVNFKKIKELNISNREYDILVGLSENLTNKEIADKLFISESTTKTHVSKVLSKLQVSRRNKAVKKAKTLGII